MRDARIDSIARIAPHPRMGEIACAESIRVEAPPAEVFAAALGADPRAIFKAHGLLPGVAAVDGAQRWGAPGQTRRLALTDGGRVDETLTAFTENERYAYRAEFSGALSRLAAGARGEWLFEDEGARTRIVWRYVFEPRSRAAGLPLRLIASLAWPGYMRACLARLKAAAETPERP